MNDVFRECKLCAALPGSPTLCNSCQFNRKKIYDLQDQNDSLTKELKKYKMAHKIIKELRGKFFLGLLDNKIPKKLIRKIYLYTEG